MGGAMNSSPRWPTRSSRSPGGPVAKAFNANAAAAYDQIDAQRVRPGNLVSGDEEARVVAEQLSRDAGYGPVFIGGLDKARTEQDFLFGVYGAASQAFEGPIFYRFARPGDL